MFIEEALEINKMNSTTPLGASLAGNQSGSLAGVEFESQSESNTDQINQALRVAESESFLKWLKQKQQELNWFKNASVEILNEYPNRTINVCPDGPKILVLPNVSDIVYCYTREQWVDKLWQDLKLRPFHYPIIILNFLIFLFGTTGNIFVCLSVYRNHQLRNVTNYFIVNLAFADLLVIIICLPATVIWDLSLTWFFGTIPCKLIMFLQDVSISVSVLTLAAISIDRYYAICHPLKFKSSLNQAKRIIALIWIISLIIMTPDVIYLSAHQEEDLAEAGLDTVLYSDCNYNWSEHSSRLFQFVKTILLYLLPFILMFCAHFRIMLTLQKASSIEQQQQHHRHHQQQRQNSLKNSCSIDMVDDMNRPSGQHDNHVLKLPGIMSARDMSCKKNEPGGQEATVSLTLRCSGEDIELARSLPGHLSSEFLSGPGTSSAASTSDSLRGCSRFNQANRSPEGSNFQICDETSINNNNEASEAFDKDQGALRDQTAPNNQREHQSQTGESSRSESASVKQIRFSDNVSRSASPNSGSIMDRPQVEDGNNRTNYLNISLNNKQPNCCREPRRKNLFFIKTNQAKYHPRTITTRNNDMPTPSSPTTTFPTLKTLTSAEGANSNKFHNEQHSNRNRKQPRNGTQTIQARVGHFSVVKFKREVLNWRGNHAYAGPQRDISEAALTQHEREVSFNSELLAYSSAIQTSDQMSFTGSTRSQLNQTNNQHLKVIMHNKSKLESRRKAAKMLMAIVVMFGICYLPVHLINFLRQFIDDIPQTDITSTISMLAHCVCYLNSAINPIIYNHMNSIFRAEFRKFLSCFYWCRFPRSRAKLFGQHENKTPPTQTINNLNSIVTAHQLQAQSSELSKQHHPANIRQDDQGKQQANNEHDIIIELQQNNTSNKLNSCHLGHL